VTLNVVDVLVMLSIEDDGVGFDETRVSTDGRMGLAGMRDRVRQFNGRVLIDSADGRGSSVTVALPLQTARASP
jgi:signal transduction histidine kinase